MASSSFSLPASQALPLDRHLPYWKGTITPSLSIKSDSQSKKGPAKDRMAQKYRIQGETEKLRTDASVSLYGRCGEQMGREGAPVLMTAPRSEFQ